MYCSEYMYNLLKIVILLVPGKLFLHSHNTEKFSLFGAIEHHTIFSYTCRSCRKEQRNCPSPTKYMYDCTLGLPFPLPPPPLKKTRKKKRKQMIRKSRDWQVARSLSRRLRSEGQGHRISALIAVLLGLDVPSSKLPRQRSAVSRPQLPTPSSHLLASRSDDRDFQLQTPRSDVQGSLLATWRSTSLMTRA